MNGNNEEAGNQVDDKTMNVMSSGQGDVDGGGGGD